MHCKLLGVPVQDGTDRMGCEMGPSALRTAGLVNALAELGHRVTDHGNLNRDAVSVLQPPSAVPRNLPEVVAWITALSRAAYDLGIDGVPIFLGGDHVLSAGTVAGLAQRAAEAGRPLFVLWLDAHADFHTLDSTTSGNLHGVPLGYLTGRPGFEGVFPPLPAALDPARLCLFGTRSVDPGERAALRSSPVTVYDMRVIDEEGVSKPLAGFLERVKGENGLLHVSLDVDFLDPGIAPAVGTTVPGGATFREAHLVMEMLHDSGLVSSVDLVELNPFLDERGRTATLIVDLVASLFGRRVMDRPTRSF